MIVLFSDDLAKIVRGPDDRAERYLACGRLLPDPGVQEIPQRCVIHRQWSMLDLEEAAEALAASCVSGDRDVAEKLVFDLELNVARLGHMPPDVFKVILRLLRALDPRGSSTYVLLVNLVQQQWSKLTVYQRDQVLDLLRPHETHIEPFEAQQAIIEVCNGKYLR